MSATDAQDDVHFRLQRAVLAEVLAVDVSAAGLANVHGYARAVLADVADVQYPAVVVSLETGADAERESEGDFEDQDVDFDLMVSLLDSGAFTDDPKQLRRWLLWRRKVKGWLENLPAVRAQPLVSVKNQADAQAAECYDLAVKPIDDVLHERHPAYGKLRSAVLVTCRTKLARLNKT